MMQLSGELRQWHKVTLDFDGPSAAEWEPSTFLDHRLDVTFRHAASGEEIKVPGFFAADGVAADSSAGSGTTWRAHFNPTETGTWTWEASFRKGDDIAVSNAPLAGTPLAGIDGASGTFDVAASDKSGDDLRAKGLLQYEGDSYLRFAGDGSTFLKSGVGSPENFLAYAGFDNTPGTHDYAAHIADRAPGDPRWAGDKGDGIIGAVNYLAKHDVNSAYMLLMNVGGDGRDVWPWYADDLDGIPKNWGEYNNLSTPALTFDVSKLAQWEIVFEHMQQHGINIHFLLQETENDQLLNGGDIGIERQLYMREMIARFGHHNGLIFNLGEENSNTVSQIREHSAYLQALDPYDHPIALHTYPSQHAKFERFEGSDTLDVLSFQTSTDTDVPDLDRFLGGAAAAGRPVAAFLDEPGDAATGLAAEGDNGWQANHANLREVLWNVFAEGGGGVEWYFGYDSADGIGGDLQMEDFGLRESAYGWAAAARRFFETLPLGDMSEHDGVTDNVGDEVLAKLGEVYAIYLDQGGTTGLDLSGAPGTYTVRWYDTIDGTFHVGTVAQVTGGSTVSLGRAPYADSRDWAVLVQREADAPLPTPVLELDPVGGATSLPDDPLINTGDFLEKTHAVTFTTGGDVSGQQVIYEQGGTVRGLNLFIEDGTLYAGLWNTAEENWGYKELQANIASNTRYVATLVMDGQLPANGTATLHLDGQEVDSVGGVGQLYAHAGDIGIDQINGSTLLRGVAATSPSAFAGVVEKITQYNTALDGQALADLNADMADGNGAGGAATLGIMTDIDDVQKSNFAPGSFQITNIGSKKIETIQINVTDALYTDTVFDPFGVAGDTASKALTVDNAGNTGVVTPSNATYIGSGGTAGFEIIELVFDQSVNGGFETGETLGFSVDMDPNSIAGADKDTLDSGSVPDWDVGGVSGAELIGSSFIVTFDDGTTATGQLQGVGNQAGAQTVASQSSSAQTVDLTVNGLEPGDVGTYGNGGPSVIVNGPAGETARVALTKGIIQPVNNNFTGDFEQQFDNQLATLAASDFPANNAAEFQFVDVELTGSAQDITNQFDFTSVALFDLAVAEDQLPLGFVASVIDTEDNDLPMGPITEAIYLQYDEVI